MNWGNYDDVLGQLRDAGLLVDGIGADEVGQRRRCRVDGDKEKRGWYHLHELRLDAGGSLLVGSFGVWRGGDNGVQKVTLAKGQALSDDQRAALKARIAADRQAAEAARKGEASRAAARATAMWAKLLPSGECSYLVDKQVPAYGVRFAESGAMVLPLLDLAGQIHGLQAIYPKGHPKIKRLGRNKDFWPAGLVKQGHMFVIGSPGASSICLVAEGYATGASLHHALGLPVVVAFDAGNLVHVGTALRKRWPKLRLLVCADDDYLGKCRACGELTLTGETACGHCGEPHQAVNAGISAAAASALAVGGAWVAPRFATDRPNDHKGPTDFNDLHCAEGLHVVRAQVEAQLTVLGWRVADAAPSPPADQGGGEAGTDLVSINSIGELRERFALVYEAKEVVFDLWERAMVPLGSMRNLCTARELHRGWMESPDKRIVRVSEVGFDPSERDPSVKCNLWAGWPTTPRAGCCDKLLELGAYLCSEDARAGELWLWLQRWLAYPIQHPGAKMKTAVIMHGPQGTGKNLFFEVPLAIYGRYGRLLNQDAVEDKFNDWASRLLFGVADEMVSRDEMYHTKNKLKTLITSDRVRINPKNMQSYEEANHANLVFLSNEIMPMAIERDDRRYAVIWTPPKWDADFYNQVLAEIRNGGTAALHDYLLHFDLGDFGPASLPPMTAAKADLIELGMDSTERFYTDWIKAYTPLAVRSCRTEDAYEAYRFWCSRQGVMKPAQMSTFVGNVSKRPGVRRDRERHFKNYSQTITQSTVLHPPGADTRHSTQELTDAINAFAQSLRDWKREVNGSASGQAPGGDEGAF